MKKKKKSYQWGVLAEAFAIISLQLKGYQMLRRRYRTNVGEIDAIMKYKNIVVFVEVKARPNMEACLEALDVRQCLRIERAAQHYLNTRPKLAGCDIRFDMVCCLPWRWPFHLENAWQPK